MAISDTQKVDYLWKKVGYGVAKTTTGTEKKAYEEAIASPLLIRGDKIWQLSASIPALIPSATASPVTIYKDGVGTWSATVQTTEDTTVADNRTWKTNLTDWIPVEFGSTYQVQVYIDAAGSSTPQSTGTKIFAAGSGNSDEWYFDYQAGVLNFIGDNLPSALGGGNTSNRIFISGARYTGAMGVTSSPSATITVADIGNLHIEDVTISSNNTNANIVVQPNGTGNILLTSGNTIASGNLTVQGNLILTYAASTDTLSTNLLTTPKIESSSTNVAVGTMTLIDKFLPTTYRTAKYVIKAGDNTGYESVEVLLIHDGSSSYVTVYGAISTTDQDIVSLSSNVYSGNVCLWAANYTGRSSTFVNFVGTYVKD